MRPSLTSISTQPRWAFVTPTTDALFNVSIGYFLKWLIFVSISVPRPEETDIEDNTTSTNTTNTVSNSRTNTVAVIEGETVFEDTYVKSVETEITMERKFTTPGYVYNLSLIR